MTHNVGPRLYSLILVIKIILMFLSVTKLTYALLLFSLSLWLASNYIGGTCELSLVVEETNLDEGDFNHPSFARAEAAIAADPPLQKQREGRLEVLLHTLTISHLVFEWFKKELPSDIPRLFSQCPPAGLHGTSYTYCSQSMHAH